MSGPMLRQVGIVRSEEIKPGWWVQVGGNQYKVLVVDTSRLTTPLRAYLNLGKVELLAHPDEEFLAFEEDRDAEPRGVVARLLAKNASEPYDDQAGFIIAALRVAGLLTY